MKTNLVNTLMIFSLPLLLVACSKTETSDMMFKESVSEASSNAPSPGESLDPMQDPSVVIENGGSKDIPPAAGEAITPTPVAGGAVTPTPVAGGAVTPTPVAGGAVTPTPVAGGAVTPTPVAGGAVTPTPVAGGAVTPTPVAGGAVTPTPVAGGAVTPTPVAGGAVTPTPEPEIFYAEKDIPGCKLDVNFNGAGNSSRVAIASTSKDDLLKYIQDGFEELSSAELAAMRKAVETMTSGNGVQFLKNGADFNKNEHPKGAKALIVTDGKGSSVNVNGLGKNSKLYIMNIVDQHSTVCLNANGITDSSQLFINVKGDPKYVSRAHVNANGSGSNTIYMKVVGGNQTGSSYIGNSMSDVTLTMITEGKKDTFNKLTANGISDSRITIKIKGKDDTGMGMVANTIKDTMLRLEMEGEDNVKAMMLVNGMSGNDVSGWLKYKSGGKVDPLMEDYIELMPLP